jgi:hypothetical protein
MQKKITWYGAIRQKAETSRERQSRKFLIVRVRRHGGEDSLTLTRKDKGD